MAIFYKEIAMTYLEMLLYFKTTISILFIAAPLLFLPKHILEKLAAVSANSTLIFRLYGVAISSLIAIYIFGILEIQNGTFPLQVAVMGSISNCGAAIVIAFSNLAKKYWFVALFFAIIGLFFATSIFNTPLFMTVT